MKKILLFLNFCSIYFVFAAGAQVKPLPDQRFIQLRKGLGNALKVFKGKSQATVAFLGGSITYNPGWAGMVEDDLQKRFPDTRFHFIRAGIPSLGSVPHAFRLKQDVLDSGKVDLLFLEAAVNDEVNGTDSLVQLRSLEGIIRQAKRNNPKVDMIMMSFADPDKTKAYQEGSVPVSVGNHERMAAHYGLASINLARAVYERLENKEFSWEKDFKDLHPSPFGQQLYFTAIKTLLDEALSRHQPSVTGKLPKPLVDGDLDQGHYVDLKVAVADSSWRLVPDWKPADGLNTRKGFVNIPVLETNTPGASLALPFTGNAVGIAIVSGGDAGKVTWSVDGAPEKETDLFTKWSNSLHLPWYVLLESNLKPGQHVLKLRVSNEHSPQSRGHACRIVHFLVSGPESTK